MQCVQFPMMAKVDVNGSNADPFYSFLKKEQSGLIISDIKWCAFPLQAEISYLSEISLKCSGFPKESLQGCKGKGLQQLRKLFMKVQCEIHHTAQLPAFQKHSGYPLRFLALNLSIRLSIAYQHLSATGTSPNSLSTRRGRL